MGAIIFALVTGYATQDGPKAASPLSSNGAERTLADDWRLLESQVAEAYQAYHSTNVPGTSKDAVAKSLEAYARINDTNVVKALAIARQEPHAPIACEVLQWIISNRRIISPGLLPSGFEAVELLTNHVTCPNLSATCWALGSKWDWRHQPTIDLLRAVVAQNPDRPVRGHAAFALAKLLKMKADNWEFWLNYPEAGTFPDVGKAFIGRREAVPADLEAVQKEEERMFKVVLDGYADCEVAGRPQSTLGEMAKAELQALRTLGVGMVAPELEGVDIEGKKLKLGDYRGRVVVVTFWATWCGPCMAQIPAERDLVREMEGRPFALIGVNGDPKREGLKEVVEKEEMTWPSFWDGSGKIAKAWDVKRWPTTYVLDANGVVRFKNLGGVPLQQAVARLLEEAEQKRPLE